MLSVNRQVTMCVRLLLTILAISTIVTTTVSASPVEGGKANNELKSKKIKRG